MPEIVPTNRDALVEILDIGIRTMMQKFPPLQSTAEFLVLHGLKYPVVPDFVDIFRYGNTPCLALLLIEAGNDIAKIGAIELGVSLIAPVSKPVLTVTFSRRRFINDRRKSRSTSRASSIYPGSLG